MSVLAIHIDVTQTLLTGIGTGIQRVVRKTVEALLAEGDAALRVVPVAMLDGQAHALTAAGVAALLDPPRATGDGGGAGGARAALLGALVRAPRLFRFAQRRMRARAARRVLPGLVEAKAISAAPGDLLVLLDAFWSGTGSLAAARRFRAGGGRAVAVVHDVIPVTHPDFMPASAVASFPAGLAEAARSVDGFVAVSRFTADAVDGLLDRPPGSTTVFRLGCDVARAAVRDQDAGKVRARRYLMVGTIEPRKGHEIVLDAFEALWRDGSSSVLVLVGKMGWVDDKVAQRIRGHDEIGKRLVVMERASDAELSNEMARADAAIMASRVEGFGLPLVENLALGTPVIASDIAVFREIGGGAPVFFRDGDAANLAEAVRRFEREPQSWRSRAAAFRWPTWHESAAELVEAARGAAA